MATEKAATIEIDRLEHLIYETRGQKLMSANRTDSSCGELDSDLISRLSATKSAFPAI